MKHLHCSKSRKVFREHVILVIEGRLFMLLIIAMDILLIWSSCKFYPQKTLFLLLLICDVFCYPCSIFLLHYFWYRCFGKLVVTNEHITWRCLFMKPHRLLISQCHYAGTESFTKGNIVKDKLGTGFRSIYVSTEPYPREYSGRIDKLRNTDTFIKFPISPRLCEALSHILPDPQNREFVTYYKEAERQKRNKKRKRERRINRKKKPQ